MWSVEKMVGKRSKHGSSSSGLVIKLPYIIHCSCSQHGKALMALSTKFIKCSSSAELVREKNIKDDEL